jgi:folate-binding protein YgfZ
MPESRLAAAARARGAALAEIDGWTVPARFGDPAGEYRALREAAALVDLAFLGRLRVTGPDRADFLQGMLSNDVKALAPGGGCPALLLTEQGKIVADLVALATADAILLDGMACALEDARVALERYVVADDVELAATGAAEHVLGVLGPDAARALERLGAPLPAVDYAHETREVLGAAVQIVRVPAPGAGGVRCHVAAADAADWWRRCLDAARIPPAGLEAWDVLRIESGIPRYGRDLTRETLALEAPLEAAISFRKGCYLGQEVVERITARGHVNRKLVGVAIDGRAVPAPGDRLHAAGREVGWVTSAAWSWRLACPIALAYVRREHLAPGTVLELRGAAEGARATVRPLPLV